MPVSEKRTYQDLACPKRFCRPAFSGEYEIQSLTCTRKHHTVYSRTKDCRTILLDHISITLN
jgi:hypothetical protein